MPSPTTVEFPWSPVTLVVTNVLPLSMLSPSLHVELAPCCHPGAPFLGQHGPSHLPSVAAVISQAACLLFNFLVVITCLWVGYSWDCTYLRMLLSLAMFSRPDRYLSWSPELVPWTCTVLGRQPFNFILLCCLLPPGDPPAMPSWCPHTELVSPHHWLGYGGMIAVVPRDSKTTHLFGPVTAHSALNAPPWHKLAVHLGPQDELIFDLCIKQLQSTVSFTSTSFKTWRFPKMPFAEHMVDLTSSWPVWRCQAWWWSCGRAWPMSSSW